MDDQNNISKIIKAVFSNIYFQGIGGTASIIALFLFLFPSNYQKPITITFFIVIAILLILTKIRPHQIPKPLILRPLVFLFSYFILTFVIWLPIRNNDWFLYKTLLLRFLKQPELSQNVVLVNVAYPDRITFRKNVGIFLQNLAQLPEKPSVVGLDIIFRKFEPTTRKTKASTAELITGVRKLREKGIPVIAGYDHRKRADYYDKQLIGDNSPFTDIGHNLINIRDGKLHANVFEEMPSKLGIDLKPFFAVLVVKYGNPLIGEDYSFRLRNEYDNILPIRYQRNFTFPSVDFANETDFKKFYHEIPFANKAVLIGNFEKDYKPEEDFYGLHAIGYAVQMLIDHEKDKKTLVAFETREWVILLAAIFFSIAEISLFRIFSKQFEKWETSEPVIPSLLLSLLCSALLFLAVVFSLSRFCDYLFADFALVFSGILVSGVLFIYYQRQLTICN